MPPLPVVINATAGLGHADEECEKLRQIFHAAGAEAHILSARTGAELTELTQRAAAHKPPIIIAGGGDGTISAVASVLVDSDIALGVLPLGTLNHFAKDLDIPLDIEAAAATVVRGHSTTVDVGEVNGRIFLNNSSLGLYPRIVAQRENQQKRLGRGKWPALFWASMTIMRRNPFLTVRLHIDENEQQYRAPFVFIGNNEYVMEGFSIGERERLDAGRLSLYVTHRRGRWGLVALAVRALFGRLHQAEDFDAVTAQNIVIENRHAYLPVATDGEVNVMATPLEYRIRPRALRVIVPEIEAATS